MSNNNQTRPTPPHVVYIKIKKQGYNSQQQSLLLTKSENETAATTARS